MGYKEYVENAILESGLEESSKLLELLESCDDAEDVESIENYVMEYSGNLDDSEVMEEGANRKGKRSGPITRERQRDMNKSKETSVGQRIPRMPLAIEQKPKSGSGKTVDSILTNLATKHEIVKSSKGSVSTVKPGTAHDVLKFTEISSKKLNSANSSFEKGAIAAGAVLLLSGVAMACSKIKSAISKSNSAPAKQIEKQIKALENQSKDVAKRCEKGEITAKEAKLETKKIDAQIKKLAKEAAKIAEESAKITKESVQVDIYESERFGDITQEEADFLLSMVQ